MYSFHVKSFVCKCSSCGFFPQHLAHCANMNYQKQKLGKTIANMNYEKQKLGKTIHESLRLSHDIHNMY